MSDRLDDLALLLPCPACGAEPGYWCVTYRPTSRPAGMLTTWLHNPRLEIVNEAWQAGRREGGASALEAAAQRLEGKRLGHHWTRGDPIPVIIGGEVIEAWLRDRAAHHRRVGY